MTHFEEVQYIRRSWPAVAALVALAAAGGFQFATGGRTGSAIFLLVSAGFLVWFWLLRLETEVGDEALRLRYRGLWFPRTIPYEKIERVEPFEYRPILEYGGWGIRRGWKEWMWNAYGNRAVRLIYRDGKSFAVGSQQPERLAAALEERVRQNDSSGV